MARVIALHTIHKTIEPGRAKTATEKAVPPKIEIIAPGTVMNVTGKWEEELRGAKAIRDFEKGEKIAVDPSTLPIPEDEDEIDAKVAEQEAAMSRRSSGRKNKAAKAADSGDGENLV